MKDRYVKVENKVPTPVKQEQKTEHKKPKGKYFKRLGKVIFIMPVYYFGRTVAAPFELMRDFFYALSGIDIPADEDIEDLVTNDTNYDYGYRGNTYYDGFNTFNSPNRDNCPYKIYVPVRIWQKMIYFVKNCGTEMGGHLLVDLKTDHYTVKITDLIIPPQKVTGSEYQPSHRDLAKNPKLLPVVKGWFHSHVNFGCFWSGLDETTISNSLDVFDKYCISIVMNKKYEYRIRLDVKDGDNVETYDDLPLYVILNKDEILEHTCVKELKSKVEHRGWLGEVYDDIKDMFSRKVDINGLQEPVKHIQSK